MTRVITTTIIEAFPGRLAIGTPPAVHDRVQAFASLVTVAVWPAYDLPSAAAILAYSEPMCDKGYDTRVDVQAMGDFNSDIGPPAWCHASHLIAQGRKSVLPRNDMAAEEIRIRMPSTSNVIELRRQR